MGRQKSKKFCTTSPIFPAFPDKNAIPGLANHHCTWSSRSGQCASNGVHQGCRPSAPEPWFTPYRGETWHVQIQRADLGDVSPGCKTLSEAVTNIALLAFKGSAANVSGSWIFFLPCKSCSISISRKFTKTVFKQPKHEKRASFMSSLVNSAVALNFRWIVSDALDHLGVYDTGKHLPDILDWTWCTSRWRERAEFNGVCLPFFMNLEHLSQPPLVLKWAPACATTGLDHQSQSL